MNYETKNTNQNRIINRCLFCSTNFKVIMRKAIAMKCTQEQFEAVRGKLENVIELSNFKSQRYLTNKFRGTESISNIDVDLGDYGREIHETWNEKVFLEACGIETETDYRITKEQILQLHRQGNHYTKCDLDYLFPEVVKTKSEVGKWYKTNNGCLFNLIEISDRFYLGYGFTKSMTYYNEFTEYVGSELFKATDQEIKTALITEAKKRGFKDNEYCTRFNNKELLKVDTGFKTEFKDGEFWHGGGCIMKDGKWAEIIPTISREEAEKRLGVKIE